MRRGLAAFDKSDGATDLAVRDALRPATEVEDTKTGAAATELVGECEHLLCRSAESAQSCDHQSVSVFQCVERAVELGTRISGARDTVINVQVMTPNAGRDQIRFLSVGALLPCRHSRVPNQLRLVAPLCLITNDEYRN